MGVFDHPDYDGHEHVAFGREPVSGLRAIVAVHDTRLGPGLGGLRMWPYASEAEALTDVLRLSRGMTYKNAMAGLPHGGGKAVIIGDPRRDRTPELMRAMGRFVERQGGCYITAEDSGVGVPDLRVLSEATRYVTGIPLAGADGHSGDPSPATALGVFTGIQVAVRHALGRDSLQGCVVAIQGLGSVGSRLAGHLHAAGARLIVSDIHRDAVERAVADFDARAVAPEAIHAADADVFAPCAMGAPINDHTLPEIRARVIAGAANNQLERPGHGAALHRRGILYAPDYVINAGGVIDVGAQWGSYDAQQVRERVLAIGDTLEQVFREAAAAGEPPEVIADRIAERRFRGG
ncbi:Glu/Leu/Phe/Val dehydrogenase dimerization domain-containing protein [Aquisalimonas lutea]|uniref:Glu/Leu/Phe/Val dehydrogenase dimerization domain-containing protein n=1 Tax=Aquisalimonas lutea TaxID=1327750 RepID=UPI0025B4D053|nr:Glu/Leu/Phe/Val dehydrogenase dimerization domain-containing protein [Aquisalimonas lutea]MDN3517315.1 Glu/Leu/Phe/Val dehydrogenase dimerization domain-containing protein [Aquisalimonas lutea]